MVLVFDFDLDNAGGPCARRGKRWIAPEWTLSSYTIDKVGAFCKVGLGVEFGLFRSNCDEPRVF